MSRSRPSSPIQQDLPLDIVGSSTFGRYPKISLEQTFNMIISDDFLVPYAGYKLQVNLNAVEGRGIYSSVRWGRMVVVVDSTVYSIDKNLVPTRIANIATYTGDVYMDENEKSEIAISDGLNIYIYNYQTNTFNTAELDDGFTPGYITYQDGRFIAANSNRPEWRLSSPVDSTLWPYDDASVGTFQTKASNVVAVLRMPGMGPLLYVFGNTVIEPWYDVGAASFPYQRNNSYNVDFGCLSPATIATDDRIVVWLGANEKSGPVIMYTMGSDINQVSTDGINFQLAQLTHPENSYAFMFKQDGHLFYHLTFPKDNLSLTYDFTTQKFFTLTNEYMDYHIAKRVAFFNNTYYFVSFKDGDIYELNTQYTTYNGAEIPRVRVCKNIRLPDASRFVLNKLTFTLEEGNSQTIQRIDLSLSKDGGESFGNIIGKTLNQLGRRPNRLIYWNLGSGNDIIPQFRFWGLSRFVATDGIASIYQ